MATRWRMAPWLVGVPALAACSSLLDFDDVSFGESDAQAGAGAGAGSSTGGASAGGSGAGASGGAPSSGGTGASAGSGSGGGGSGGSGATGGSASGGTGAGGSASGGGGTGGSTSDPHEAARQLCIDTINQLRATKGLPPYQRWTAGEDCADKQAADDEQTGMPHNAWKTHKFGCDGGSGQNECLGGGANGIVSCLNAMWAEKDQPGCAGCDQCTGPGGCANCDFYGDQTGDVCGHYVNMRATWFSQAACGFGSSWAVINFK